VSDVMYRYTRKLYIVPYRPRLHLAPYIGQDLDRSCNEPQLTDAVGHVRDALHRVQYPPKGCTQSGSWMLSLTNNDGRVTPVCVCLSVCLSDLPILHNYIPVDSHIY